MKISPYFYTNFYPKYNNISQNTCPYYPVQKTDSISFRSDYRTCYKRRGGDCLQYYEKNKLDEYIYNNVPSIRDNTFNVATYNKLSEEEKDFLRDCINIKYKPSIDDVADSTIEKDMEFFIGLSENLKNILDKKYPQGWKFISIGGSTALFAQILEYLGAETLIVPFSQRIEKTGKMNSKDFDKYFDNTGLTNKFINNQKKKIYSDFVSSGCTIYYFMELISETNRLTLNSDFTNFTDLFGNNILKYNKNLLNYYFFNWNNMDSYTACPEMIYPEQYKNAKNIKNEFDWNITTKLMNFAIIDHLSKQGKLKQV